VNGPNDLAPRDEHLPHEHSLPPLSKRAAKIVAGARSKNTLRAQASDWRQFEDWCRIERRRPLPATPATVAGYLLALEEFGKAYATIRRHLSTISTAHKRHRPPVVNPAHDPDVADVMRGILNSQRGAEPRKATAIDGETLIKLTRSVNPASGDRVGHGDGGEGEDVASRRARLLALRDRSLLLLGFALGVRRSELVGVHVEHIKRQRGGIVVTLGVHEKTKTGWRQEVGIDAACVETIGALDAWLKASGIKAGPVFRRIYRDGSVGRDALSPQTVAVVVKRMAKAAGLEGRYSGHSLRRGFLTAADRAGKDIGTIMGHSRHRSREVAMGYLERRDRFEATRGVAP
jgi:integrase